MTRIRPGQLWRWNLTVGDGGWPCQRVTELARWSPDPCGFVMVVRDDLLTVVVTDDSGPYQIPSHSGVFDLNSPVPVVALWRWHVALVHHALVWLRNDWFEQCELVCDVG